MKQPRFKYIVHHITKANDTLNYVVITDTQSGKQLASRDVPESNAKAVILELSGGQWKQNYYFVETTIDSRRFKYYADDIPHISSDPVVLAEAFRKVMRSRKKRSA